MAEKPSFFISNLSLSVHRSALSISKIVTSQVHKSPGAPNPMLHITVGNHLLFIQVPTIFAISTELVLRREGLSTLRAKAERHKGRSEVSRQKLCFSTEH